MGVLNKFGLISKKQLLKEGLDLYMSNYEEQNLVLFRGNRLEAYLYSCGNHNAINALMSRLGVKNFDKYVIEARERARLKE